VTVSVPDDVIGPPGSVKPYTPAPVMLVTAAPDVTDPAVVAYVAVVAVVANVAVAAFPVILIGHVPVALEPSALA